MPRVRSNFGVIGPEQTISSSNTGFFSSVVEAQQLKGSNKWPNLSDISISPAFNSKTSWNFDIDGPLNITTGSYTITPTKESVQVNLKMWGEGGYGGRSGSTGNHYASGAGAALVGNITLTTGQSYFITFFGGGTGGASTFNGSGGNAAGIFSGTSAVFGNSIAIAAGGGGAAYDDGGRGSVGGAGGNPNGAAGTGYSGAGGGGGTQSSGGTAGSASNLGTAGSQLQGGSGGTGGGFRGGGGGGGYYGGGGAAIQSAWASAAGGGGSSYANTSLVTSLTHYSGSGTTPGNSADAVRNGAGSGIVAGTTYPESPGTPRINITKI